MVHVLKPEIATVYENKPEKIKMKQPSVKQMKRDIHDSIRQFLVNPTQCASEKWCSARFEFFQNDENDRKRYIHEMSRGIQDFLNDMYTFSYVGNVDPDIVIYTIIERALPNAIDIFGDYAIEQQALYIFAALMETITPTIFEI